MAILDTLGLPPGPGPPPTVLVAGLSQKSSAPSATPLRAPLPEESLSMATMPRSQVIGQGQEATTQLGSALMGISAGGESEVQLCEDEVVPQSSS